MFCWAIKTLTLHEYKNKKYDRTENACTASTSRCPIQSLRNGTTGGTCCAHVFCPVMPNFLWPCRGLNSYSRQFPWAKSYIVFIEHRSRLLNQKLLISISNFILCIRTKDVLFLMSKQDVLICEKRICCSRQVNSIFYWCCSKPKCSKSISCPLACLFGIIILHSTGCRLTMNSRVWELEVIDKFVSSFALKK